MATAWGEPRERPRTAGGSLERPAALKTGHVYEAEGPPTLCHRASTRRQTATEYTLDSPQLCSRRHSRECLRLDRILGGRVIQSLPHASTGGHRRGRGRTEVEGDEKGKRKTDLYPPPRPLGARPPFSTNSKCDRIKQEATRAGDQDGQELSFGHSEKG